MMDHVVLVDEHDRATGTAEKMAAHRDALLHRAFSVFVFNRCGEMLLQQRALTKYHSGGLWSNACCSHPRPGESILEAAHRRSIEEMGVEWPLRRAFAFVYRAEMEGGLTEFEYDHVLIGRSAKRPRPNPAEVADWRWVSIPTLALEVSAMPERFTIWFRIVLPRVVRCLVRRREYARPAAFQRSIGSLTPPVTGVAVPFLHDDLLADDELEHVAGGLARAFAPVDEHPDPSQLDHAT